MQNLSGSAASWLTSEKKKIEVEINEVKEKPSIDSKKISEIITKLAESHREVSKLYDSRADKNISDCLVSLQSAISSFENFN